MNICFCNTNENWGGGEKWHLEMANAISDIPDYNVSFLLSKNSEIDQRLNTKKIQKLYLKVGKLSFLNPAKLFKLFSVLKKSAFDLIIFNGPNELKFISLMAKRSGIDKIIYRRGSDKNIKNSPINRYLLENVVTDIIANSEATKQSLLFTGIDIKDKIRIINNGVQPPKGIQPNKSADKMVIGALGRLEPQKGFDFLIQSASVLKKENIDFKLLIAGTGSLERELKNMAINYNIEDHISFVGFKDDVYEFLNSCDVFALSSRYEGFGYVMVEAMFCGKPVVAYDTSSASEIVRNDETGYLIKPYDIKAFANALKKLLDDQEKRSQYGMAGKKLAYEKFSFDESVKQITSLFRG